MTDFLTITACGECCTECPKKKDGRCPGCIAADGWVPEWAESGRCRVYACTRAHHVPFCGLCAEFPCSRLSTMIPWNAGAEERMATLRDEYRRALPYRAVIVDFDRTLLHTDKSISEYTVRVLKDWQNAGARLFAATARPERAITEYRETVPFDAVTTLNGARTITRDAVHENRISPESAEWILSQLLSMDGTVVSVEAENGIYANTDIPEWSPDVTDNLRELPRREGIYKILASHPDIPAEEIRFELPEDTYSTIADRKLVQVMGRDATKWNGVRRMLEAWRIDPAEAVFFGDDNDDIEPIRRCGRGVAVSNAPEHVREAADDVTASNDEDGVAVYLDTLIRRTPGFPV